MTEHRHVIVFGAVLVAALVVGVGRSLVDPAPSLEASVVATAADPGLVLKPLEPGLEYHGGEGTRLLAWCEDHRSTLWVTDGHGKWSVDLYPQQPLLIDPYIPKSSDAGPGYSYCIGCAPWSVPANGALVYALTFIEDAPEARSRRVTAVGFGQ